MSESGPSRGSRALRRLVVFVVVLALLALVVDRVGDYVAERLAGSTIQSSQHLSSRPSVDVHGFPFLTQFAHNTYEHVTITADDLPVGPSDHRVTVSRVQLDLRHVVTSRSFDKITARSGRADGVISYAALGHTLGVTLRYDGNGRIRASRSVTVAGHTFHAAITTAPQLVNGGLGFTRTAVNGLGQLGGEVSGVLNQVFNLSIPLQGIPFQVRLRTLSVAADGLHIVLTGRHLTFTS